MHMRICLKATLTLFLLTLFCSQAAFAAEVWVTKSGNNVWTVYGRGLETIGGIFLSITYETTLKNPVVTQGSVTSGVLASSNVATPGTIRFAAVNPSPFSKSSGDIATISFGSGHGKVTGISSELATANDNNPRKVAVNAEVRDSGDSFETTTTSSPTPDTTSSTGSSTSGSTATSSSSTVSSGGSSTVTSSSGYTTGLGGVTFPTDDFSSRDRKEQPAQPDVPPESQRIEQTAAVSESASIQGEPENRAVEEKKGKKPQYLSTPSVLNRLKDYKGEKKLSKLTELFNAPGTEYRQNPKIFLADGVKTVKITIPVDVSATASPNFALSREAQMATFPKIEDGHWVVELKPKKGVYEATLSYFLDDVTTDIPVTVSPLLETYNGKPFTKLTETDLNDFLSKTAAGAKADLSRDLNGDKLVDYVDEYIFLANYLVQAPQPPALPAVKPEVKPQPVTKPSETPKDKAIKKSDK